MSKLTLSPKQWPKILAFIRECSRVYGGQEAGCKRFIEAVLWVMRSGGQWRQLPVQYGKWNTVYKRFARWCQHDVWERMRQHFTSDADTEFKEKVLQTLEGAFNAAGEMKVCEGSAQSIFQLVFSEPEFTEISAQLEASYNPSAREADRG